MIRVGILGATGYAGVEVVRLLSAHKGVTITRVISQSFVGQKISDIYHNLKGVCDLECMALDIEDIQKNCDLVFTALPHGASKTVIPTLFEKGLKIVDLSGDFRYNDPEVYAKWYGEEHSAPDILKQSVYGLPELHREKIRNHRLIGNPGCYTTCSILGLAPLVSENIIETRNIIIDAKSGVTGAGRSANLSNIYCEVNESLKAYGVGTHRHTSEIEQELSLLSGDDITLSFTPHLVPMQRGILATCYANLSQEKTVDEIVDLYKKYYKDEKFVRVYDAGALPEVKHVKGSNYIDIGIAVDARLNRVVVVSCVDNLIKGAAGQAIQNMNLICGFDECEGLIHAGFYL